MEGPVSHRTDLFQPVKQERGVTGLKADEEGEVNVRLTGISNSFPVVGNARFDLEIRAESGGSIVVERTMPDPRTRS